VSETVPTTIEEPVRNYLISAWLATAAVLWLVLRFDLLPALLAGLLVFELVHLQTMRSALRARAKGESLGRGLPRDDRRGPAQPGDVRGRAVLRQ
jgi:hypothetical protein